MTKVEKRIVSAMDLFADAVVAIKRAAELHAEEQTEAEADQNGAPGSEFPSLVVALWKLEGRKLLESRGIDPAEVEGALAVIGQRMSDSMFEGLTDESPTVPVAEPSESSP
jgi:hypothetical protein